MPSRRRRKKKYPPVAFRKVIGAYENYGKYFGYQHRAGVLKKLGYASYTAYLDSDLWHTIRSRVLDRQKHVCEYCKKQATQVHHLAYGARVLLGKEDSMLVAVCSSCHVKLEFDKYGRKKTFWESTVQSRDRLALKHWIKTGEISKHIKNNLRKLNRESTEEEDIKYANAVARNKADSQEDKDLMLFREMEKKLDSKKFDVEKVALAHGTSGTTLAPC